MKMTTLKASRMLSAIVVLSLSVPCGGADGHKQVAEFKVAVPTVPAINVQHADKFLNDLKLSPYWKVEKDRNGAYVATARSVEPDSPFEKTGREFVFELMAKDAPRLSDKQAIHNNYLSGSDTFTTLSVAVVFQKPTSSEVCFGARGSDLTLRVYEYSFLGDTLGPNSFSFLALKLSDAHDIYLLLREQGADKTRQATVQKLAAAAIELKRVADLPEQYLVSEMYGPFLELLFKKPLKDHDLGRFPGMQDRDTFYGYFKAMPHTSYEGVNIKVSHPVYCPDEGTRKSSRLAKAEYIGKPYRDGDVMFFLIEDNAVYLLPEYDKQFGTFSGTKSFDGTMEILNADGAVLLRTTEKFKGWER